MRNVRSLTFLALAASLGLITAIVLATNLDGSRSQPPRTEVAAFDGSGDPETRTEVAAAQAPETDLSTNAQTAPADGGQREAVRVHGHWTIEIREPDGSLVRTVEFENALTSSGAVVLPELLARTRSAGTWSLVLWGSTTTQNPCRVGLNLYQCVLIEAQDATGPRATLPGFFPTLRVSVPATGPNAGKLVLAGTATATGGDVGRVDTDLNLCTPSAQPTSCNAASSNLSQGMTSATVQPSQPVQEGQQILVTVVISFR